MHATHYAYAALGRALGRLATGATIADAYTQHRDELRLVLRTAEGLTTLVVMLRPPAVYAMDHAARARRNVADVLGGLRGRTVTGVRVPPLDRHLVIDLDDGAALDLALFGPRPNALLVRDGRVDDAFLAPSALVGTAAPASRPATLPEHAANLGPRLFPTFDAHLAAEALARAGVAHPLDAPDAVLDAAWVLHREALASDAARIYWDDAGRAVAFSLVPLRALAAHRDEPFDDVADALRVFSRRRAADAAFARRRDGLAGRLAAAAADLAAKADALCEALAQPSRADAHEAEGHLLMAHLHAVPPGASEVTLPDLHDPSATRTLALDPALSAVQNAQGRYDRARRSRAARRSAEARLDEALRAAAAAADVRDRLGAAATLADLDDLARAAAPFLRAAPSAPADARLPYHRVDLGHGYEAWVGRSAADNDALTLRHARPYDLWLHARGVSGSHVVLRVKGRTDVPPAPVVERAARLAAHYSKAKTSALVPVVVTPRKWVRKAKGSPPGQVIVEREAEVRIVPPEGAPA